MRQDYEIEDEESGPTEYSQYNYNSRSKVYVPMGEVNLKNELKPGYYNCYFTQEGPRIRRIETHLDGLVTFPSGVSSQIINEIDQFWMSEDQFREINKNVKVLYKRGILMYGPPGCGKSSMISIIMHDIVGRGGIALRFNGSETTTEFVKIIRQIQPKTKILIVLEDIDGYINRVGEEDILNMLDGVDTVLDNILFIGTSNYVHELSQRMLRPSRFDLKIELNYPEAAMRKKYLEELYKSNGLKGKPNLAKSVKDTEGFSFADLKELFISTCVFGRDHDSAIKSLRNALNSEDKTHKKQNSKTVVPTFEDRKQSRARGR